ncbi:MAG TPA: cytochrome c oxidase subunit II [Chitinophagaceae bacterium]|nr:cytochrome c oxidase subunit II [Chitinophagaceae bacterium]
MSDFFLIAIFILFFLVVFQISKASEYVSVLKGEEKARKQNNRINGFFMILFLIAGLIGVWYCNKLFYHKTLLSVGSASEQGKSIDLMLWITLGVTGSVFIVTQTLLFWFAFRYQESDKRKSYFFAHSNKLEIIWTSIPALVLTVLIVFGLKYWFKFTSDAPKGAQVIEITGHQFGWEIRYPGKDGVLGRKNYKLTDPAKGNPLGVDWSDPASHDDIHVPTTMHVVVNKPVKLVINSQDVIHDVGLPQFGMKMDAVPGTPTTLWFTPLYTTEEMKKKTGNPDFVYEIACDQLCGVGHYTMRGVVVVETQAEFDAYMASQKPEYYKAFPDLDPDKIVNKDSTTAKAVAQNYKK